MQPNSRPASQLMRRVARISLLFLLLSAPAKSSAHDEWFRGLDLEPALTDSTLVLVGRVADVSETKIGVGGKGERALLQFKFAPVRVLKGVFSRESLLLTSEDLAIQGFTDAAPIEPGQLRLLMLGRSSQGYGILRPSPSLEQSIPPLRDANDGLLEAVRILLAVNASAERPRKIALLLQGLRTQKGAAVIPLLAALERRSLVAAQTPGVIEAIAPHLSDPSPAVREQAARALYSVLKGDYLDQSELREGAVNALAASLERADSSFNARVPAFDALGAAGPRALNNKSVKALLELDAPPTFAEQAARLRAMGELKMPGQQAAVLTLFKQVRLDAPPTIQYAAEWALARLDPTGGIKEVARRTKTKYDAGFSIATEINVLGDLTPTDAVPALLDVSQLHLDHAERYAFASASAKIAEKVPDARLVAPLARMLAPSEQDIWWKAIEALTKIDTDAAAKALQPYLREETDLLRKLEMAEFLGRHGIRDGYPYAVEHMSEPYLREHAIAALAAIREPRAVAELRKILETSNDVAWNNAAVRGLGRLGAVELAPQFLEMARNAKSPLAPCALIALGDLHEARALEIVREGLASRNTEMVTASARAAGSLAALPGVKADDVRDQLAALLADPAAPQEARAAALDSLVTLKDQRLESALTQAVRDAGLEGTDLLEKIEKLLRERKVRLTSQ